MSEDRNALRIGVVGVGHLGAIHARLWAERGDIELAGVFDLNQERAAEIAAKHDTRPFASFDELLASVDAISLVTPTSTHAELGMQALMHGIHCFIEKPITARYDEALPLVEAAENRGLTLQVGHVERFNPALLAIANTLPEPMFIESHRMAQYSPRATDVAVVLDLMIHDIDLALYLVKSGVEEVRASGVAVVSDTIDIANARIEFANGCVANLTASRISQRPMRKMRLFQHDAYISLDFAKPAVEVFRISDDAASASTSNTMLLGAIEQGPRRRSIVYEQPKLEQVNAIALELGEFVTAIRTRRPPPVTAAAAAEALRVAEIIVDQVEHRRLKQAVEPKR